MTKFGQHQSAKSTGLCAHIHTWSRTQAQIHTHREADTGSSYVQATLMEAYIIKPKDRRSIISTHRHVNISIYQEREGEGGIERERETERWKLLTHPSVNDAHPEWKNEIRYVRYNKHTRMRAYARTGRTLRTPKEGWCPRAEKSTLPTHVHRSGGGTWRKGGESIRWSNVNGPIIFSIDLSISFSRYL